ncbi:hypothetical protein NQ317_015122 [Molorchus minor]|uniref:Uncharacterized protein n=1 Tax=Molorchus minor TaxID=1323400 RepID=A0ABQ9K7X2_9CUCU|nr:hypothetical protein NQ317_015122 [Molorchus minor]
MTLVNRNQNKRECDGINLLIRRLMGCRSCLLLYPVIFLSGVILLVKLIIKFRTRWCRNKGLATLQPWSSPKRGARVILACRDEARATEARDRIVNETGNENVVVKLVNFSSLASVKGFAKDILENEARLDILVNNAGIGVAANKKTDSGLDYLMQVNHFGPVLLTILLADLLKKSSPSRIVNVSSVMASFVKLDIDNLNSYGGNFSYSSSKLCNILFTMHLAKLLEKHNVTVYSVHPGAVNTEIFRKMKGLLKAVTEIFKSIVFKTAEEGAQTTIYAATERGIEHLTGRHFVECRATSTYKSARDPNLPQQLFDRTVELLQCEEEAKKI